MAAYDADTELMLRVKRGDRAAFRQLVERYQQPVINIIYRAIGDAWEAEDLAQRVFLQVYRAAGRYQPRAKFSTWLFAIVHNTIRNEHRRRTRHATESLEALTAAHNTQKHDDRMLADDRAPDPAQAAATRELQDRIHAAIQQLPHAQRTAVVLCRYQGFSYEDIARVLGCSVSAVKSLLHRARQTLKEQLRDEY